MLYYINGLLRVGQSSAGSGVSITQEDYSAVIGGYSLVDEFKYYYRVLNSADEQNSSTGCLTLRMSKIQRKQQFIVCRRQPTTMGENKKVLLGKRKRHTARRVTSARYAALSNGWGGYPIQTWDGVPLPIPGTGYPPPRPGMGYPHPDLPSRKCEQTENITFPHPSDAGGNNVTKLSDQKTSEFLILHFKVLVI